MATQTSTVPGVIDALKAILVARPGLAGVVVTSAPSGAPVPVESIQLFGTDGDQAWDALGNRRRRETYTLNGGIAVQRRDGQTPEAQAKAVRDRAYALLAELEDALRTAPNLGLPYRVIAELSRANLDQGIEKEGRFAAIDIGISVTAHLVSN